MRCKCCDNPKAKWWGDDFYCHPCRNAIKDCLQDMYDNGTKKNYEADDGEIELLNSSFDDEDKT